MSVVYDLRGFQSRFNGERGIARYVLQLALGFERTDPGLVTQYLMHPNLPFPPGAELLVGTGKVVRADRDDPVRAPSGHGVFVVGSPFEDYNLPSEVVFPHFARTPGWRTVAVLYDLIPQRFPDWYHISGTHRRLYHARLTALSSVDRLLAISDSSARDAAELLGFDPRHITVIGAGADHCFKPSPLPPAEVAARLAATGELPGLRPGYVLFPGGIDPRKNLERTINGYGALPAELRDRHQLVLACRLDDAGRRRLAELAVAAGVSGDVVTTGYVNDDVLCRLYQGAHLVIFPSLYEGFGLPVIEAMACRAPVIVADASSLPEVQTIAEARFDPLSAEAIRAALSRALGDEPFLQRLRDQPPPPFTWDNAAARTAATITELLHQHEPSIRLRSSPGAEPSSRSRPPRLAVVSPLPPQRSAASTYAFRLVAELRHLCDVTVFVDADPGSVQAPPGVAVEPIGRLDLIARSGGAFDRILSLIGSSRHHVSVFESLQRLGGWALLHDIRLAGLYRHVRRVVPHLLEGRTVGATLAALYPNRYHPNIEAMDVIDDDVADRYGILLVREVVERAERVLVHSAYDAALVGLDTGLGPGLSTGTGTEPLAVCPYPSPAVPDAEHALSEAGPAPVVSVFGPLGNPAAVESLLHTMAVVRSELPAARLRIVGPHDDDQRALMAELAQGTGLSSAVELVEPVGEQGYLAAGTTTTLAVQLQRPATANPAIPAGSAVVADMLACGVPTIVADLGPFRELPDEAVVKADPNIAADDLGRLVAGLLTDVKQRAELAQAARDHAKSNSYAQAAQILTEALFGQ